MSGFIDAIKEKWNPEFVYKLNKEGYDINERDEEDKTALHYACELQLPNYIEILLNCGANVNIAMPNGTTALHMAVNNQDVDITKLLLQAGADTEPLDEYSETPLVAAKKFNNQKIIDMLMNYGADPAYADNYIFVKLLAHRFNLHGLYYYPGPDGLLMVVDLEGFNFLLTIPALLNSLENFLLVVENDKFKYQLLAKTVEVFKNADHYWRVSCSIKDPHEQDEFLINYLKSEQVILLPIAIEDHATCIVLYKDLFAFIDRGVKDVVDTTIIYRIKNPRHEIPEKISKLFYFKPGDDLFEDNIKKNLNLELISSVKIETQIVGNCSWASGEAAIGTIFFMLLYADSYNSQSSVAVVHQQTLQIYYAWLEYDRITALNELEIYFVAANEYLKPFLSHIIAKIIVNSPVEYSGYETEFLKLYNQIKVAGCQYAMIIASYYKSFALRTDKEKYYFDMLMSKIDLKLPDIYPDNMNEGQHLLIATKYGDLDKFNADPISKSKLFEEMDEQGNTLVHYAAYLQKLEILYFLYLMGADLLQRNKAGFTPIHYAINADSPMLIKYFLEFVPDVIDMHEELIIFAAKQNRKTCIEVLNSVNLNTPAEV